MGAKCWCHSSDQDVHVSRQEEEETAHLDDVLMEHSHHRWKEGSPAAKALKEPCWEAFSKELEVVKVARQAHYKFHQPNFEQEGLYDLSSTLQQLVTSTNLLVTKIHEVQGHWSGWQELRATNKAAKASQRDIHCWKLWGWRGCIPPEALYGWSGLSFCPWCGKEGQKKGTVVN